MSGIDTNSTTPDPEHLMGKWQKNKKKSHKEAPWGQLRLRAIALYFKVVRGRKPSSAQGTIGWRAWEGYISTLSLGGLPQDSFLILSASMFILMG